MSPWPGREKTDIVYEDESSVLTSLLIQKGYLHPSTWEGRSPTYYIEVKTTPNEMSHPFFCSQQQYDVMESMQLSFDSYMQRVYVIARVFRLGGNRMGIKLYVDPASLRSSKELAFNADKYSVTPRMHE